MQAACATRKPLDTNTEVTRGRTRRETRTVKVFNPAKAAADTEWKPLVKHIIQVSRDVLHRNAKTGLWNSTCEVAYYLANARITAPRCAAAIRGHRRVENTRHYTRDVTFPEDQSRIRNNPGIFARMRSFAYNILRCNQTSSPHFAGPAAIQPPCHGRRRACPCEGGGRPPTSFVRGSQKRRGWPAFAGHDTGVSSADRPK